MASSEEEGLHARPLPHILGEYICDIAVYFGGGRIGTFSLPPHMDEGFSGGGGGTGPPPRNSGDFIALSCIVDDYAWEVLGRGIAPRVAFHRSGGRCNGIGIQNMELQDNV